MQFNLPAKRFYTRVFLPDYILVTANEHSLRGIDELLFVWPLPFDLPGMGDPIKRFYLFISYQVNETHKLFYLVKIVFD